MGRCPRCGRFLDEDTGTCLHCGYSGRKRAKLCPECGDALSNGVCYRCGYRAKGKANTCPYCKQKLIRGFCQNCNYKKGETKMWVIILLIMIAVGYYFFYR